MNRIRRAAAFVVILLLAQLTLVTSGFTCVAKTGSAGEPSMADMPGMTGTQSSRSQGADESAPTTPASDSCTLPWAPSGCTLMIPCAPNALPTLGVLPVAHIAPIHADLAGELAALPSAIIAPDPPPPKA